jgi:hypothetical protein
MLHLQVEKQSVGGLNFVIIFVMFGDQKKSLIHRLFFVCAAYRE